MSEDPEPTKRVVSRREALAGGTLAAGLLSLAGDSEPAVASHTEPSEPIIELGDSFVLFDAGDDAVIKHKPSGAEFAYNVSESRWELDAPLSLDDLAVNKVGAKAHLESAQSIPHNTVTQVNLDTQDFDDWGDVVDLNNNQFVIQRSGIYVVSGIARLVDPGDDIRITQIIQVNGSSAAVAEFPGSADDNDKPGAAAVSVFDLSDGDTVNMASFHNNGSALNTDTGVLNVNLSIFGGF